ncbi:MAG TPA: polysaccharide biosynthesis/export family protein [Verrucomicrobiae bacterium]|jgi:protein involved in polysaccharide export with SLBB domain
MKLFIRGLFLSLCLLAGSILAGCGTISENPDGPHSAAPVQGMVRFRVGETVIISFSGLPSGDPMASTPHQEPIKDDGTITLPYINSVVAVGKTAGELQTEIHDLYVPKYYLNLTVTVSSGDRVYYVGGEIKGSGLQMYVDGTTVTKAIQAAGGLTDFANHHNIKLIRASTGQVTTIDYDQALQNPTEDPTVYPGDQINVSRRVW